jgi:hypothetical protein
MRWAAGMTPGECSQRTRAAAAVNQFRAMKRGFRAIPNQLLLHGFAVLRLAPEEVRPQHDQPLAGPSKIAPGTSSGHAVFAISPAHQ